MKHSLNVGDVMSFPDGERMYYIVLTDPSRRKLHSDNSMSVTIETVFILLRDGTVDEIPSNWLAGDIVV